LKKGTESGDPQSKGDASTGHQESIKSFWRHGRSLEKCDGALDLMDSVMSLVHDLEGMTPAEAARRISTVTYEPRYLAANLDKVECQVRLEIENPTPWHAADLQFQASPTLTPRGRSPECALGH
jgi:hypothetical protein